MSGDHLDSPAGWTVALLGFATLVLVWGIIFTFTVYAGALAEAFGLSRLRVSAVFSITSAAFFVVGGAVGVGIARMPLRPVVAAAGLTIGLAVGLLQVVTSYTGLVAAFALVGTAGGTVFVVTVSLVPQWFDRYRGLAMGVTMTGNGLGVLVMPLVWVWLLARVDVRAAVAAVGGATVAVVLLASLVYRRPPGVAAGADPGGAPGEGDGAVVDLDWLRAKLTDTRFVVALVGYPLLWSWYFVLSSSLVDVLTAGGIDPTVAATAFGTIGGISILSRLASGAAADRVGARLTLLVGVGLAAIGVAALTVVGSPALVYPTLAVFGVGLGAIATLFSPIIVGRFGAEHATAVVGLFTIAEAATAFGAPIGLSVLVDATGGYVVPLVVLATITALGAGLFHWGTAPAGG